MSEWYSTCDGSGRMIYRWVEVVYGAVGVVWMGRNGIVGYRYY